MKKYFFIISLYLGVAGLRALAQTTPPVPVLHIEADQIIAPVSPVFSGMMTEEINHAYDGGLYAELIQNRVFKDDATYPAHWSLVQETGAVASVEIVSGNPVLTAPSVQAVKRWKFKPFMEDGKAIRVLAPINLDFKL